MERERERVKKVLQELTEICRRYSVQEMILFGSWAKETAHPGSDIDVAVSGAEDIEALREEAEELETLYRIDIVDLDTCRNDLLKEDIAEYGRKIYQKV